MATLPPPETSDQRKARQFGTLHHLGDLAHDLACDAHARAKEQLAPPAQPAQPPARRQFDFADIFTKLFRAVRDAIALEHRLDAPARARTAEPVAALVPDSRRALLRQVFHDAVAKNPDAPRLRREINDRIEEELQAHPQQDAPLDEILVALCNSLQIELDLRRVPDELLGIPPRRHPSRS